MTLAPLAILGIQSWSTFLSGLLAFFALYLIISISLNVEMGYAGIPNFGKVLYFMGGAAFSGSVAIRAAAWIMHVSGNVVGFDNFLLADKLTSMLASDVPASLALVAITMAVGGLVGGILGYVSIFPAIRLREDYLAMLLLGSAAFFQIFLGNYTPIINGTLGIGIPNFFAWAGSYSTVGATLLIAAFAVIVYIYSERMVRSPLGRTLRALRDNEAAAEALGKDTVEIRRNVLIIASIITGVAGALYTIYTGDTNPAIYDRVTWTFWPWFIVILGGVASNSGVAVGTFVFVFLLQYIDATKFYLQDVLPFDVTWLEYLLFGSLLIVVLLLRPQGLLPEKPSHTLPKPEISRIVEGVDAGKDEERRDGAREDGREG
ncbi:MAG TPA: branched-chain amino acid ABC transporter permease [Nitrososphaerales archaeon]|nr:branched-chain amino acid ABC transporter permease [Nitrososphaerales archaeon]